MSWITVQVHQLGSLIPKELSESTNTRSNTWIVTDNVVIEEGNIEKEIEMDCVDKQSDFQME